MKLLKKFGSFSAAFIVSLSSLMAVIVPQAHATVYTCVWTGASSANWNTAGNWSACNSTVPQSGDIISFNLATPSVDDTAMNNDITGLSVSGIILTGAGTTNKSYKLTGNKLTIAGTVTQSQTSGNLILALDVDLGADLTLTGTVKGLQFGAYDDLTKTLNLGTYSLIHNLSGTGPCKKYSNVYSRLKGSGAISITGGAINLFAANNTYTGNITNSGSGMGVGFVSTSLGAATTITINGSGQVMLSNTTNATFLPSIVLNTDQVTSIGSTSITGFGCAGSPGAKVTATLSGALTLNRNSVYYGDNDLNVTGTFTANGYTLTTQSGSNGSITTSAGTAEVPVVTTTLSDSQPEFSESVSNRQTVILDGTRDSVGVSSGGKLMGTGTARTITTSGVTAIVAPGHSPGTLTVLELFDMSNGGTYEMEIKNKTDFDKIKAGSVNLGTGVAVLTPSFVTGYGVTASDTFMIVENTGATPVTGTFKDLAEGATFRIGDGVFKITYVGGTGNDIVLSVVTVPSVGNTGFKLLMSNPYTVAVATLAITAGAYFLSRRTIKVKN